MTATTLPSTPNLQEIPVPQIIKADDHSFDVESVRADFPILQQQVRGKPLVYLDNAATSQKPQAVIDVLNHYYTAENANIHRGVHFLSEVASRQFEEARVKAKRFLNAADAHEIIFVRGCTEAINLVAGTYGRKNIGEGDEIIISTLEHHSNIVPWQMLCEEKGAVLRVIPINDVGELILEDYEKLLNERTKFVSVVHISNALGTINPVKQMIGMAHRRGIPVLLDGAQSAPHMAVDVQELDCDFYTLSGHKLFGPTGIGVLYGKAALLNDMPPYQGGGDMISSVTFEKTLYNALPYKFEAGTPNIAGAIGLGAAIDYVSELGLDRMGTYEAKLLDYATEAVREVEGLRVIGTARHKASILSFVIEGKSAMDVGALIDLEGVAIRTGHHCTQPLMNRLGVPGTARASFACYNTTDEIDIFVRALHKACRMLD
jgi:cysteine desulfurase/selenocysteine lyase